MSKPLDGRVVLVTGGGRGIGRAHCLELARQGAAVVVNDPGVGKDGQVGDGAGPAFDVVAEIVAAGGRAVAHTGSVSNWADTADMVATAVSEFGTLTGVVNNAGIVRDATVVNATEAEWDAVMAVHLKGTFAVSKHACEYWRSEAKGGNVIGGRIVNTVSGAGLWGNYGQGAYGAAKAAIANLTVVTAMEGSVSASPPTPSHRWRSPGSVRISLPGSAPRIPPWTRPAVRRWWPGCSPRNRGGSPARSSGSTVPRSVASPDSPKRRDAISPATANLWNSTRSAGPQAGCGTPCRAGSPGHFHVSNTVVHMVNSFNGL